MVYFYYGQNKIFHRRSRHSALAIFLGTFPNQKCCFECIFIVHSTCFRNVLVYVIPENWQSIKTVMVARFLAYSKVLFRGRKYTFLLVNIILEYDDLVWLDAWIRWLCRQGRKYIAMEHSESHIFFYIVYNSVKTIVVFFSWLKKLINLGFN